MTFHRAVPAYIWHGDDGRWAALLERVQRGDLVIVTGPESGPPRMPLDVVGVRRRIGQLRECAAVIVGYVALGYGARPYGAVMADVGEWRPLGVDGAWFDEAPASITTDVLRSLRGWHGQVRSWRPHISTGRLKGVSAWNPGTWHPSINDAMRALPDSIWCTVECAHEDYAARARVRRSTWPLREVHLVHACPAGTVTATESEIRRNVGWGYATTDGPDGNPWDGG